jgi:T-complex protein 1 subunit theta
LSGSKVVRGMVFGRESEGTFFLLPLSSTYKTNLDQTSPRKSVTHTGTIEHATAAKVAVFTCALDIAQTETERTALIKNTDEIRGEVHLAKVRRFLTPPPPPVPCLSRKTLT